jgi:hypothetical protein
LEATLRDVIASSEQPKANYFADRLRLLRQRLVGKQMCLSCAVGCTDAAVSFWESGKRVPEEDRLSRILEALAQRGASVGDLSKLRSSWEVAKERSRANLVHLRRRTAGTRAIRSMDPDPRDAQGR